MKKLLVSLLVVAMLVVPASIFASAEGACACAEDCAQCRIYKLFDAEMTECACIELPAQVNTVINDLIDKVITEVVALVNKVVSDIFKTPIDVRDFFTTAPATDAPVTEAPVVE